MEQGIRHVGDLREGEPARVRGRVRAGRETLTSPHGARPCVAFEVRRGWGDRPAEARGAVDFVIEDATGRVLVRAGAIAIEARAVRRQQVLGEVDRDVVAIAVRLREIKDALRAGSGRARELHAERRRLAEVATLLCAVTAQGRGRVHVGGTLAGQDAWIAEHASAAGAREGAPSLRLVVERYEIALEPGDDVEVEGVCARETLPAGIGGGYRDQATALVIRAPEGGVVSVRGVGAIAATGPARAVPAPDAPRPPGTRVAPLLLGVVALAVLAWLLAR